MSANTTAVVTGGARGFGLEIARRLVGRGHRVVVTDIDDSVTAVAAGIGATGVVADARSADDHRRVAALAADLGRVAVWVNNAGLARVGKVWEISDDDVTVQVGANVLGVVHGSRAAVAVMRDGGGHLLNIASMSAHGPVPGMAVYAATKSAVLNFTTSLQGDLDLDGIPIRAHALCPHAAATDLVGQARDNPDSAVLFSQRRLLTADQVADAAITLLDGRRIVRSLPWGWAVLSRLGAITPTVGLRGMAVLRGLGERARVPR